MPGGNGQAYLSEDARKEAQRRMLAEKYGLGSDTDSDAEESEGASEGASATSSTSSAASGAPAIRAPTPVPAAAVTPPASAPVAAAASSSSSPPPPALWPGAQLADPMSAGTALPIVYRYRASAHAAATARRECPVTMVTLYQSMYAESVGRKICVDPRFICYAVGGHIRVLARGGTARCLLKGHGSGVVDLELAVVRGGGEGKTKGKGKAKYSGVLGSVAEDGSVYVWVIDRLEVDEDEGGDDNGIKVEKRDSVRLEHPGGGSYERVSFRPVDGAVPSENGIGVAMLMLDRKSDVLRVTELVKMGDKTKLRDKEFSGGHNCETGEGLGAAAWLTKTLIATAKGGEVCLWGVATGTVSMRLERDAESVVSGLHVLQRGDGFVILLVAAENGSVLEVWSLMTTAGKSILVQQLRFEDEVGGGGGYFNVVARDVLAPDFVAVTSLRTKSVFVLHYRQDRACLDSITELPVKEPVLSFCVTKDERTVEAECERGLQETSSVFELGLWCVYPSSIKMTHVQAAQCIPSSMPDIVTPILGAGMTSQEEGDGSEVPDSSGKLAPVASLSTTSAAVSTKAVVSAKETAPAGVSTKATAPAALNAKAAAAAFAAAAATGPTAQSTPTTAVAAALQSAEATASTKAKTNGTSATSAAEKAITILKKPATAPPQDIPVDDKAQGLLSASTPAANSRSSGVVAERSAQWEAKTKTSIDTPESTISISSTGRKTVTATSAAIDTAGDSSSVKDNKSVTGTVVASPVPAAPAAPAVDEKELLATVTAVARKIVADFDAEGVRHSESEMKKTENLVISAMARADASVKKHVSESMKVPMASAIIPVLSEVVSNASATTAAAQAAASSSASAKVTTEWFARCFQESQLSSKFGNACTEMTNQASDAVKTSMATKFDSLVEPSVKAVEDATSNLSKMSKEFVEAMQQATTAAGANGMSVREEDPGVIIERIANLVTEGRTSEAFQVSIGTKDPAILLDVASRVDASEFCESNSLSQFETLELARTLGQNLSDQPDLKVSWLEELMLIIEPADDSIVATAPPILQQLLGNIAALRRDTDIMNGNAQLKKKSKKLSFLISSLAEG